MEQEKKTSTIYAIYLDIIIRIDLIIQVWFTRLSSIFVIFQLIDHN